ncbi:MAG TPA: sigma 54-interacting transcriptional regulator [Clostridiales bacterium]|nr:sigma 54-interacting transcriptional regulator [Clostridiales bacterium]
MVQKNNKIKGTADYSKMLESILNHISEAVYISDIDGEVLFINKEAENTDGINLTEVIGKKEPEIYGTNNHAKVMESGKPILNEKTTYTAGKNQVKFVHHSVYPFFLNDVTRGTFSISKDITKEDQYISKIYQLQQELKNRGKQYRENGTSYALEDIIGHCVPMLNALKAAKRAAKFPTNVLLAGETGTGKEMFAQGIHNDSAFCREPFVGLNCAAIPENLLESTLFGTVKGSYTGSENSKGLFEQAGKGTLFLDEIDSMPLSMQAKLLRALQEKRIRRVGGKEEIPIHCRIISATNVDINKALDENIIRPDIYYRLASITIEIPPLRRRKGDGLFLTRHFIEVCQKLYHTEIRDIDDDVQYIFSTYAWPGNVRELEHTIESMIILANDGEEILTTRHLPEHLRKIFSGNVPKATAPRIIDLNTILDDYERSLILTALKEAKGNVSAAARNLSIHRNVLYGKIQRLHIDVPTELKR